MSKPRRPRTPLCIGITLMVRAGQQSIWENGIFQNCVFLAQLLRRCPGVGQVVLVNGGDEAAPDPAMMLEHGGVEMIDRQSALARLDVLVEMSALMPDEWVSAFHARGGRLVWMRVGNDYVIDIERAMFNKPNASLASDKPYDAVWTLPEYEHSCRDYYALTTRAPVSIVPHLWTPLFFDKGISTLPGGLHYGYEPGRKRWRVCAFEPNVSMVKTSVIPMLVCEEAYRARPQFLESLRVCNTLHLKEHLKFLNFAQSLDVVRHGIATFEGRFAVYEFMAHYGDCIVSHHWENGQNYLYYEALHGGYPLVHNSAFIRGYGYYYEGFDCQAGGAALLAAFDRHDEGLADYRAAGARLLRTLAVDYPENVKAYAAELQALYA